MIIKDKKEIHIKTNKVDQIVVFQLQYKVILGVVMKSLQLDDILNGVSNVKDFNQEVKRKINPENSLEDLYGLIQQDNYVGEVIGMEYEGATVQISEHHRQKTGGLPSQGFLIATRINPRSPELIDGTDIAEHDKEDCCVILMRIQNSAQLPTDMERMMIRIENSERAHELSDHWETKLDATSKNLMSFTGLKCRIVGTFYLIKEGGKLQLKFGSDVSNFYSNRGLKVYKPTEKALQSIVNFGLNKDTSIKIGHVRYVSTQRVNQGLDNVPVVIDPMDLVAQKTAIFGMTRTGKSNTVKTIVKAIYQQRFVDKPQLTGQIIFDPNGEYANENLQDRNDATGEAQAIRNLYKVQHNGCQGNESDIQIYSLSEHKNDKKRKIMKINFYDENLIQIGKDLIDNKIQSDGLANSIYMSNFQNLEFVCPDKNDKSAYTRYLRNLLVYKTLLSKAGYEPPKNGEISTSDLFSKEFLKALNEGIENYQDLEDRDQEKIKRKKMDYEEAYAILYELSTTGTTYGKLEKAFKVLNDYIQDPESTYQSFNKIYIRKTSSSGASWADNDLQVLLTMFQYSNASKQVGKASIFHNPHSAKGDYAQLIYDDLKQGRLVIVDQALGDSNLNKIAAARIVKKIFMENSKMFADAQEPTNIIIFVEEAHNLMPKGSEEDNSNIWARVAKEGAKFKIGMAYSTQEVSSIQRNILKNTNNWFISHLNSREEVSALKDYYDFEDFAQSILKAEDKGFIRMKTRSNRFVVPIQVDKFQVGGSNAV